MACQMPLLIYIKGSQEAEIFAWGIKINISKQDASKNVVNSEIQWKTDSISPCAYLSMTTAEFGGSKAWSVRSSPLIYHLLQRGTVDSFAEDRVKAWWVAGPTHQSGWGQNC